MVKASTQIEDWTLDYLQKRFSNKRLMNYSKEKLSHIKSDKNDKQKK